MTWVKIDDAITEHPKCVNLSPAAWTLWIHGLTYCSRNLTDGFIPAAFLSRLSPVPRPKSSALELVEAGLWHKNGDGFEVHNYCQHQRTRADVEAERVKARERQARRRKQ